VDGDGAKSSAPDNHRFIRFGPPRRICGPTLDPKFALSSDGSRMLARFDNHWQIVDTTGAHAPVRLDDQTDARMMALSPSGKWAALGGWNNDGARIFDATTGRRLCELPVGNYVGVLFSPDERYLVTAPDGVRAWRTSDWRLATSFDATGSTPTGLGLAIAPDSRTIAIGEPSGQIHLADVDSGRRWATLVHPELTPATSLAFSQDQSQLAVKSPGAGAITYVWNLTKLRQDLADFGLDWPDDVLRADTRETREESDQRPIKIAFDREER
jgi:WD40 repeat protein